MEFDPAAFGMNSWWAEVASAAAKTGVEDRLSSWKSESAKCSYVKASLECHLEFMSKGLVYLTWPVLCASM